MPREYLTIGSAPSEVVPAQVGSPNYSQQAHLEISVFERQLKRMFPEYAQNISHKWFRHEFGDYCEVIVYYSNPVELEYALRVEGECPDHWDSEAQTELK